VPCVFPDFHSTINPEELFRKIFGQNGFKMSGFSNFEDFAEADYGFAGASGASTVVKP
jgi:DnaJ family protein A protein 3